MSSQETVEEKVTRFFISVKWLLSEMYFNDSVVCWLTYLTSGQKKRKLDSVQGGHKIWGLSWLPPTAGFCICKELTSMGKKKNEPKASTLDILGLISAPSLFLFILSIILCFVPSCVVAGSPVPHLLLLWRLQNPFGCCGVGDLGFPCLPWLITSANVTTHVRSLSLSSAGSMPGTCIWISCPIRKPQPLALQLLSLFLSSPLQWPLFFRWALHLRLISICTWQSDSKLILPLSLNVI